MGPLDPIYHFRLFTIERLVEIRQARENAWAALTVAEQPKPKKPRATKEKSPLHLVGVPLAQQAEVLAVLKKLGLA